MREASCTDNRACTATSFPWPHAHATCGAIARVLGLGAPSAWNCLSPRSVSRVAADFLEECRLSVPTCLFIAPAMCILHRWLGETRARRTSFSCWQLTCCSSWTLSLVAMKQALSCRPVRARRLIRCFVVGSTSSLLHCCHR